MNEPNSVLLEGIDGSNPLAFLAALGALRTLTAALPGERVVMSWEQCAGSWQPRLWCSLAGDSEGLIATLEESLTSGRKRASFQIGDNLNLPAEEYGRILQAAVKSKAKNADRIDLDFFAAFGSEAMFDDKGIMADTALRTMSGAGHQHFLKFIREIVCNTDADHLRRALLSRWDYADEGRGMNLRWDPLDDRRYALRWQDPSADPVKTMRGANRLAIEALPLLPTCPTQRGLSTTCFEGKGARDTVFTWPLWEGVLDMNVVRSTLAMVPSLRQHSQSRLARGVSALYASRRITIGKFRNFTPAEAV